MLIVHHPFTLDHFIDCLCSNTWLHSVHAALRSGHSCLLCCKLDPIDSAATSHRNDIRQIHCVDCWLLLLARAYIFYRSKLRQKQNNSWDGPISAYIWKQVSCAYTTHVSYMLVCFGCPSVYCVVSVSHSNLAKSIPSIHSIPFHSIQRRSENWTEPNSSTKGRRIESNPRRIN